MFGSKDWEKTRARHARFWEHTLEGDCLFSACAPLKPWDGPSYSESERAARRVSPEALCEDALASAKNTYCAGDAFSLAFLDFGAAGHAGFFPKAKYKIGDTVWFFPSMDDTDGEFPQMDENSFLYKITLDAAEMLARKSEGRYIISTPDTSGNLDALAHLRGSVNALTDFYDDPDWVCSALKAINGAWLKCSDEVFKRIIPANDGGSCVGWMGTWAPGRHSQLQCDLSVMLSPAQFEQFALPDLIAQAAHLDHPVYHLDGREQTRHLDMLLSIPNLDAIQWTWVAGQPSPAHFIPEMRRIQKAGVNLVLNQVDMKEIPGMLEELNPGQTFVSTYFDSKEEAEDAARLVRETCARRHI